MKALIVTISTLFLIVRDTIGQDDGYSLYSRRYERLDIDTILASPRLVTNYVECLLSKKPCPPEGKSLKRILPEALRTKCGRCWPSQKEGALKVITALYNDYPQHYQALRERWDPTGEYHRRFEEYLRDQKFNNINSNGGQENADQGDTSQATPRPIREGLVTRIALQTTTTTTMRPTTARTILHPVSNSIANNFSTSIEEQVGEASGAVEVSNRIGAPDEEQIIRNPNPPIINKTTQRTPQITRVPTTHRTPQITRVPTTKRIQRIPQTVIYMTPKPLPGFHTHTSLNTNNPILNIINHLTLKVANTAELLTGMLHRVTPQDK